jgi:alpha/beta superfamily hydrolase
MVEHFTNSRGVVLAGRRTIKVADSHDIYVVCHGLARSMDSGFLPELSSQLPYNTFRFDFTGCGLSQGEFSFGEYSREVEDLRDVVAYLRDQGFSVKGVVGHSKGAAVVLMYNARYGDIPLTIRISGRFYMHEAPLGFQARMKDLYDNGFIDQQVDGRDYRYTLEAYLAKSAIDIEAVCRDCRSDVIVIHGERDRIIHVKDAYASITALGPKFAGSYIIPGACHFFLKKQDEVVQAVRLGIETYFLTHS